MHAEPDLVGNERHVGGTEREQRGKLIGLLEHLFVRVAAKHEVGDPDGEAIDDDGVGVGTRVAYAPDELGGLLDRAPVTGALRAMPLDPFVHFRVAGERRRHEGYARVRRRHTEGEATFAAARTAEDESRRSHARVLPRRPRRRVRARAGLLALGSSYSPRLPGLTASGSCGFRPRSQ